MAAVRPPAARPSRVSAPYRDSLGRQRSLNTRTVAQTLHVRGVGREPVSHVVAASHAPSVEDQPKRINHGELSAKRVLLTIQPLFDVGQAPLIVDASALLDRRVTLLVRYESLGTEQLRVRDVNGVR